MGTGVLFVAVGWYVAQRRPRVDANLAFGLFAAGFGVANVFENLFVRPYEVPYGLPIVLIAAPVVAASIGLFAFGARVLTPASAMGRAGLTWANTVGLAVAVPASAAVVVAGIRGGPGPVATVALVAWNILVGVFLWCLVAMAYKFRRLAAAGTHTSASQAALFAVAFALWPGALAGDALAQAATGQNSVVVLRMSVLGVLWATLNATAGLLWIVTSGRVPAAYARTARNVGLVAFAVPLVAMIVSLAYWRAFGPGDSPAWGVARLAAVLTLAYGVLRHQLFDIDLRIKWTIKRSTLVALFVALFFVVSELATVLFAERVGPVLGILSAGALLFALAPLQRLADRVSDAAMPHVRDTEEYRLVRKHQVYRAALESAYRDGDVSDLEKDILATLADELGLSATDARAMEREVTA